ncbi:subtilisin-like protein [Lactarius psammicola]|nr:subtilisin-like protein [Lactarius psammicola]
MLVRYHLFSMLSTAPLCCLATPLTQSWDKMTVKHAWGAVPENWESRGHPPAGTTIDLYLELKSHRENALIEALYDVSEPRSSKYGAHLSKEQVAQLVAPHEDTLKLVNSWFKDHGIPSSSVSTTLGGNWLTVIGVPVARANDILGASYQLYQHFKTNRTVIRTISYSLPEALHEHINTVAPTTYFGSPRTKWTKRGMRPSGVVAARTDAETTEPTVGPSTGPKVVEVTPSYLRLLYKTSGYVPAALEKNAFGIAGYSQEYPSPWDLWDFMKEFRTDGMDATYTVEEVNGGGYDPDRPGSEASVDLQYAEAITYPTRNIYYSTGGEMFKEDDDPYLHWLEYVIKQEKIPQTISTAYGDPEVDHPIEYAKSVCRLFAQLGSRGVSVLFASGDAGVGEGDCVVEDTSGNELVRFLPVFPATCPWVTAVGGTTGDDPEEAAVFSGGGFSDYFPREIYQADAVPTFLQTSATRIMVSTSSPDGRGIPDLAAQALNYQFFRNRQRDNKDGTSCSTSTVAGIISLLNDYRLSKGKRALGFLNPWLYSDALAGLNDITSGSNPGCGTDGFTATAKWDAVTGLGSPDFDKLEEIIDNQQ